ncbi:DUF4245 domain-containing protein [Williamsia sterculiae]|uniref:DUF4245 domain-containing protein n=1 Tax=Williamsia sterculiae TaxID=1344003 RepID=A0A1N7DTA8_9NOCA|nr:DUF4245 domain-containing protein [Williamsia sterculiae]SIR78915.1 Protein of unknown function [Williamsia sterculiae]
MAEKPRILNNSRDMIWSLVPLLLICGVIAVVSGNCSVGLSGTARDDKTPAYDVNTGLRADARTMPFPLRLPVTPEGWKPNSGSTDSAGTGTASNVGYVTARGIYLQLTQSDADEGDLVTKLGGTGMTGAGTVDAAGRQWVRYNESEGDSAAAGTEKVWITDLGDVRIGLSGKADDDDFTTLATAVLAAQPLSRT